MLSRELDALVSQHLSQAFRDVETHYERDVGGEVRSLVTDLVRESLLWREEEWAMTKFKVDQPDDYEAISKLASQTAFDILAGAATLPQYDLAGYRKRLSLISVIEWIKKEWCNVFPFCR